MSTHAELEETRPLLNSHQCLHTNQMYQRECMSSTGERMIWKEIDELVKKVMSEDNSNHC